MNFSHTVLVVGAFFFLCYESPSSSFQLSYCLTPDEWAGRTCEEICDGLGTCYEGPSDECHDATAIAYKRQDACWAEDEFHNVVLPQGCDDPLPETLTDSVYFVQCCCGGS